MANNRVYLRCKTCSDTVYLAKYYPNTGWYIPDTDTLHSQLNNHTHCTASSIGDIFTLEYEITSDSVEHEHV